LLAAALDAALAEIAAEAFLVDSNGAIIYANPAGRACMAQQGDAVRPHFVVGQQRFRRCVLRSTAEAGEAACLIFAPLGRGRVTEAAARRWSLTPRQTEVLTRMIAGDFNKEIAGVLACSRRAVEHHITAILRKTGTHSRAELLGRVFTDRPSAETNPS
jgi:DNA-binding CsgD family transcriptional regulator